MLTKNYKMFNKKKCMAVLLALPCIGFAQQPNDTILMQKVLNEINVNALRAGEKTPVAFTSSYYI